MIKAYINQQETSVKNLSYDEYYYRKYNENNEIVQFRLTISYADFIQKLKPMYEAFILEMKEDDRSHNDEDFFKTNYGMPNYPSFQNLITKAENGNYKIDFINDFFAKEILNTYIESNMQDHPNWIIRKLTKVDNDNKEVFIFGEAQPINY